MLCSVSLGSARSRQTCRTSVQRLVDDGSVDSVETAARSLAASRYSAPGHAMICYVDIHCATVQICLASSIHAKDKVVVKRAMEKTRFGSNM